MGELRQDLLTGRWVVLAPSRGDRPVEGGDGTDGERPPSFDPECPFCPGNEDELPSILWEGPGPDPPGWRCRAVPNRYPAFQEERPGAEPWASEGVHERPPESGGPRPVSVPAVGHQEVIIESPRHDRDPGRMSSEEATTMLAAYRERLRARSEQAPDLHPLLFRNHGRTAGASLRHPHAQLVATRFPGPRRQILRERLEAYARSAGTCMLCQGPRAEPGGEERVVDEDEHYVAWVPWGAERPLETRIVPRRHAQAFRETGDAALEALARILTGVLRRLRILGSDPDYNYVLHTWGPVPDAEAMHWHLEVRPRIARAAGFELGTGVIINPSTPEQDARALRRAGATTTGGRDG